MRVDDRRDRVVVDVAVLAGDEIADHHALVLRLVREHRAAHAVADGPDVLGGRLAVIVHLDEAALVELHARAVGQQVLRERLAAHAHDQLVDVDGLTTRGVGVADFHSGSGRLRARDFRAELDVEPLFLEVARGLLRERLVGDGEERVERFEDDHLRTEPAPHAAELEADDARADDRELLGHGLEIERAPVVDDVLAVERPARKFGRDRARREHDVLRDLSAWSATARNVSSASRTITSEPSRRHTLPSSRPMTPAPTTASFLGTVSKSSAPQLSTMFLPSNGMLGSSVGTEPAASTTCFAI